MVTPFFTGSYYYDTVQSFISTHSLRKLEGDLWEFHLILRLEHDVYIEERDFILSASSQRAKIYYPNTPGVRFGLDIVHSFIKRNSRSLIKHAKSLISILEAMQDVLPPCTLHDAYTYSSKGNEGFVLADILFRVSGFDSLLSYSYEEGTLKEIILCPMEEDDERYSIRVHEQDLKNHVSQEMWHQICELPIPVIDTMPGLRLLYYLK